MPAPKRPKIRAVWLGQALKEIREAKKLTAKYVGAHVGKDASTISRIESGEQPISEEVLESFLDICEMHDSHRRSDLRIIRRDAAQGGWWDGYRKDVAPSLMDRAWMESKAITIRAFDITYIPGLLQLPEFAGSLMRAGLPSTPNHEIQRWVDMRMQRQHIITKHRPVKFHSIIDEQLLRRRVGTTETMREQLDYLVEASQRPNVEIRLLPADRCIGVAGSFVLFDLIDPYPAVASVATPAGDLVVEGDDLEGPTQAYDRLLQDSLEPEVSRQRIIAERDQL